jgi:hypothetical protein
MALERLNVAARADRLEEAIKLEDKYIISHV